MFEKILFRPGGLGRDDVDLGEIAEAMVFYGQVLLVLSEGSLRSLLAQAGIDDLLLLADSNNINITVLRDGIATHEANNAKGTFYDFISFQLLRKDGTEREPREIIQGAFLNVSGKPGKSRRAAQRFLQRCKVESINEGAPSDNGIPDLSRQDLGDSVYVIEAVRAALSVLAPGYRVPLDFRFNLEFSEQGFKLNTNLDLNAINAAHKASFPGSDMIITYALILDALHGARGDLFLASRHSAELVTSPLSSTVVSKRVEHIIGKTASMSQVDQLQIFQAELIHEHSIREAINSKERSIKELLDLVESASCFRSWLSEKPADSRLIREYSRALVANTWAEKLPAKSIRYVLFTAAGLAVEALFPSGLGLALGLGLSAGDTFLLEKIIKGWKPNQFIEKDLQRFLVNEKSGGGASGPSGK